jgi:molecular chaperone GrpE
MDITTKELLINRFRAYLEELPEAAEEPGVEQRQTDLFSLFTELATLKNEVRLESRQVKTALDEFRAVFDILQSSHSQLNEALERLRAAQQAQRRTLLQPLLLELLELYERLEAGLQAVRSYRRSWLSWLCRREKALIEAIGTGQEISLRRLEQLLNSQNVTAIEVTGKPLDPHSMRAAEVDQRSDLDSGIVTEELRKGFTWEGELLRLAEVKVNKRPE